jgi:hypothetical protein
MVPPPDPPTPDSFQRELSRVFDAGSAPQVMTAEWWAQHNRSPSSLTALPITRRGTEGTLPPPERPPGELRSTIAELANEAPTTERVHELASRLSSRAAWELGGADVVAWLLQHDARAELVELFALVFTYAPSVATEDGPHPIVLAMHEAFGRALLDELELEQREPRALRSLCALELPPRLWPRVRRAAERASGSDASLAKGLAKRARRSRTRTATLDALVAAVHLLTTPT